MLDQLDDVSKSLQKAKVDQGRPIYVTCIKATDFSVHCAFKRAKELWKNQGYHCDNWRCRKRELLTGKR